MQIIDKDDEGCDSEKDDSDCFRFYFMQPARFPDVRHDLAGAPYQVEGVVIHEGMSLTVFRNGMYRVKMTVTAPDTALTLRLRLRLTENDVPHYSPEVLSNVERPRILIEPSQKTPTTAFLYPGLSLTLPPIRREPRTEQVDLGLSPLPNEALATFNVVATGYSAALHRSRLNNEWGHVNFQLHRDGTALIGSRPAR